MNDAMMPTLVFEIFVPFTGNKERLMKQSVFGSTKLVCLNNLNKCIYNFATNVYFRNGVMVVQERITENG